MTVARAVWSAGEERESGSSLQAELSRKSSNTPLSIEENRRAG